ncbi:unnamed protein product [Prorocentrum cordatum]|uniref:Resolvase/invertase-type recombinase catalytic domain-containing protein n=1 Tax=Prorocentrum cordatum TaxID=2364126 RepID=A0ABN9SKQ4_9DINO|nr:unnamed protein product [Polarella glacialis]
MPKGKVFAYARTSSKTNAKNPFGSRKRQIDSALAAAGATKKTPVELVCDVICGTLPLPQRSTFTNLLEKASKTKQKKVYVGESRAVARNYDLSDELYKMGKKLGVTIVAADAPGLFDHNPGPLQVFQRRVDFARTELEKDLTVLRLGQSRDAELKTQGAKEVAALKRKKAKLSPQKITFEGKAKLVGRRSTLEKKGKLTNKQVAEAKKAIKGQRKGRVRLAGHGRQALRRAQVRDSFARLGAAHRQRI